MRVVQLYPYDLKLNHEFFGPLKYVNYVNPYEPLHRWLLAEFGDRVDSDGDFRLGNAVGKAIVQVDVPHLVLGRPVVLWDNRSVIWVTLLGEVRDPSNPFCRGET